MSPPAAGLGGASEGRPRPRTDGLVEVRDEEHPDLVEGDDASFAPSVSASGRYVAFVSRATNLVEQDAGRAAQVFVRDRARGRTWLVSTGPDSRPANADAVAPSISGDGRYIAFVSLASNLVAGDTNAMTDVFVHDRVSVTTRRVSVGSDGRQADGTSGRPAISADGRSVAFVSHATNLVTGESSTNGEGDVFVHDRASDTTRRVSAALGGGQTDGASDAPSISGDGRYVAFDSEATNLAVGDTNDEVDVFLYDRQTGAIRRVSTGPDGVQADGPSQAPSISPNGEHLAFETASAHLNGEVDQPGTWHVVHHDRVSGTTTTVTRRADGPSHSAVTSDDGRVAFVSAATNLSPHWEHNGLDHVYEWRRDQGDERIVQMSVHDHRGQANAHARQPAISANGYVVAFASPATTLTAASRSGITNVFTHTWVGVLCIAVLVSAADLAAGDPVPVEDGTDDNGRLITIYREVGGKHRNGVYFRPQLSPSEFRLDAGGISMLERQSLRGEKVYIVAYDVWVQDPAHEPGNVGIFVPPVPAGACQATFTPSAEAFYHWDGACQPFDSTPQVLSTAAKAQKVAGRIECNERHLLPEGRVCRDP